MNIAAPETDPTVEVVALRTADDSGLIATGTDRPLLSWTLRSDRPGVRQTAYEVETAADASFRTVLATTGTVNGRSQEGPLPGPALASRETRWWRIRARTDRGWTAWSEPARVEAALLGPEDWTARPMARDQAHDQTDAGLFRREFELPADIRKARLYVTALGVHETRINGELVSPDLFDPGWTEYRDRLLYASYDVTDLLAKGPNTIASMVGDGWYRGSLGWFGKRAVYGDQTALLAQLEVELADGNRAVIGTDDSWRTSTGEVTAAGLYEGCDTDLRKAQEGWHIPGFNDESWQAAVPLDMPKGLEQRAMPAVRVLESRPAEPITIPDGWRIDAGQNLTGYLRISADGPAGSTITVRHAEVLDNAGELHTAPLRTATATDRYTLTGKPVDLEPRFTVHGFCYAEIKADPGVEIHDVKVMVVASDLTRTGHFECSDERVNRLYENVIWSQRGNFLAIPTDCPQRDERCGWTGDAQVFAPTACHNFDSRSFLRSWLRDLAIAQHEDGKVAHVVPDILRDQGDWGSGSTGWGDAAVMVPWALYEAYGDLGVLAEQYESMRAWVDWGATQLDDNKIWSKGFHFGDWLDPGAPPDRPAEATTPTAFVATAYLARSARLLARISGLLGNEENANGYATLGDAIASAVWNQLGEQAMKTQTGCAMALEFDIAPEQNREEVGNSLATLVRSAEGRIATGFLGTPLVLDALTETGHHEEAYLLLLNERCPGWLHQVKQGGTTVWERWDSIDENGRIHEGDMAGGGSMLSFNHYAYGAVASWLYRTVAGLASDEETPGWQKIVIAPVPGGGMSWAAAEMDTPLGKATIRWETQASGFKAEIEVPPGAEAEFLVPPGNWTTVEVNGSPAAGTRDRLKLESGTHKVELSGS